ncbi:MCE family protein [Gandjariella thermophila]|uniref:ABC transporter substrate-binding protein n=1 Tax=Gandjariella thermophila TaxID=1931992 RepID=A0A4D4J2N5_9PSEU|nr:MCE family protein [Gandjariella thermophila]GDY29372.1 ABC transporter substrate-binding protein [Gandjariella thermophila]
MSTHSTLSTVRRRLLGVLFIVVIVSLIGLTVAVYKQAFTSVVPVTLQTDHVGNQLQEASDVKVRGLIVGEVRKVTSKGDGAVVELALQPDKVNMIPANVTAQLLPKTLFGERYVDLEPPKSPSSAHLKKGDVIGQDRSGAAIELERVLSNLMPLLQAVQPQKLSTTLTALSQALANRGQPLGQTMVQLNQYLGQFNQQLPNLEADLKQLATFTDTYSQAAPNLVRALSDMATTSKTLVEQQNNLANLYSTLTTTSQDLTGFLRANKNNLIQLADTSQPTLNVLAKYAPAYPCFLKQMAQSVPLMDQIWGKGTNQPGLHVTLEITKDRGKYVPNQDEPQYADKRGPRCYDISPRPEPFPQYPPDGPVKDGSKAPPAARSTNDGVLPPATATSPQSTSTSSAGYGLGLPNSPAEEDFLAAMLAPQLGVQPQDMPNWTSLLVGPLFRGAEVTLK